MWIRIEDALRHAGEEVEVRGWLYHKRSSGKIHFLLIRDGTGVIQGVLARDDVPDALFDVAGSLTQESAIIVRGTLGEDRRAPGGLRSGWVVGGFLTGVVVMYGTSLLAG